MRGADSVSASGERIREAASKNPRPQPGGVIWLPWEGAGAGPQPSTFTDTVDTRWALGARTLSRPSR